MKKQKIKIILAIIIIILCMTLFQNIKKTKGGFQDELIFFKLFSSVQKTNHHQYNFKLEDKKIESKNVKLTDTIDKETLIEEKIAPGTKGNFKPHNLKFQIKGKDKKYEKLEDMQSQLQGEISENKRIIINWEWKYEENEIKDKQDTKDGQTIGKYYFTIYTIGKSLYE